MICYYCVHSMTHFIRLRQCSKCGNEFPSSEERCDQCDSVAPAPLIRHKVSAKHQLIIQGCSFAFGFVSIFSPGYFSLEYFLLYFFLPFTVISGAIISYIDARFWLKIPFTLFLGMEVGTVMLVVMGPITGTGDPLDGVALVVNIFLVLPSLLGASVGASARLLFIDGYTLRKGFLHIVGPGAIVVIFLVTFLVISFLNIMEWTQVGILKN